MRVGLDITPIAGTRTGVGNYCFYLLKHLVGLGSDCEFVGFASGTNRIELGTLQPALLCRRIPVPTRLLYKTWTWLRAPKVDAFLGGVDVFHATNVFLPPTRACRTVVTIHDLCFLAAPDLCSPKIVKTFSKGVSAFASQADAILVYSHSTRSDLVEYLGVDPAKVTVAPIAVDEAFTRMDREEALAQLGQRHGIQGPFLLFVSTLEPRKNVVGLLRAFARLVEDIPHDLVLVGPVGWNAEPIFEASEDLGLSERVVWEGFVESHLDLTAFYSAADAFVFPTFYEGFGLPLLEAMTCGCPVVTSNHPAVQEVVGDAGLCTDPNDIEAIADAIARVLEDDGLRQTLIARGLQRAKTFSWDSCARTTLGVYRSLA